MMLMPPMSDPSEPSERMERADNPSKTVTYALIFGGLTAAAAAAYFLTRTKRTPLPSAELIASGAVPGVTVNAGELPTNLQTGLQVAANPFANATRSVSTGPTEAEYGQKVTDILNWSRPILAFAMGEPMQQASMTGYRRLSGPFDIVKAGLGTVAAAATSVSNQATAAQQQVAEAEARARAAAAAAIGRTAPSTAPDYGWSEVREWLRTGRLPMNRNKSAWNQTLASVGVLGSHYFSSLGLTQFGARDANNFSGFGGTMFTGPQLLGLHGYTRQMYDLWVRGGANATAIPQDRGWAPSSTNRNFPFKMLQSQLNAG